MMRCIGGYFHLNFILKNKNLYMLICIRTPFAPVEGFTVGPPVLAKSPYPSFCEGFLKNILSFES